MTDEDSGDENGGLVDNLCGRQLRARAEIEFIDGNRVGDNSVSDETTPCFPSESHTFTFLTVEQSKWVKGNLEFSGNFQKPNYSAYFGLSPTKLFELFIDNDVISLLINESTKYAFYKDFPNS